MFRKAKLNSLTKEKEVTSVHLDNLRCFPKFVSFHTDFKMDFYGQVFVYEMLWESFLVLFSYRKRFKKVWGKFPKLDFNKILQFSHIDEMILISRFITFAGTFLNDRRHKVKTLWFSHRLKFQFQYTQENLSAKHLSAQ